MFGAAHRSAGISLQRGGRRRDREMFRRGARCLIVCNGLRALTERNGTFVRPAGRYNPYGGYRTGPGR